jgi:hypothetical protein
MGATATLALAGLGACAPQATCVTDLDPMCTPLYAPTFDNVYTNTLVATCAQNGVACHAPAGRMGGLYYSDPDTAYGLLLGTVDGRARVLPGDPACSILVERIEGPSGLGQQMPPGKPLPASVRCAIEQWIRNGAKR